MVNRKKKFPFLKIHVKTLSPFIVVPIEESCTMQWRSQTKKRGRGASSTKIFSTLQSQKKGAG
jgi:hypothetical protein